MRLMPLLLAPLLVAAAPIDPSAFPKRGTVDPRFQSYNVEMVEVTGGRFWKPYRLGPPKDAADRYAYRPPMDLANPRLRMLAAALGPAYVRVSGTWANTTFFGDAATPPEGFSAVLTPAQWNGVVDFTQAVGGELVLSFAGSPGARDAAGVWQPDQMRSLLAATARRGGRVAGAEFLNEPNLIALTGAPKGYGAAEYGRDFGIFAAAFRQAAPGALVLGPGSVGDGGAVEALAAGAGIPLIASRDLLAASPVRPDVFSYHHYGAMSERCGRDTPLSTMRAAATGAAFLDRTATTFETYRKLRDAHVPGAPIWLTETGQAACGGDRWAATFADTPRYVDQLGRLAREGVQVVAHNTLAASDYALLDEEDFSPRPSYWAALLWRRLMGTTVLDAGEAPAGVRLYAHCLAGRRGGVALLAVNTGPAAPLPLMRVAEVYALEGSGADQSAATLNGRPLALGRGDALPDLRPARVKPGAAILPASSVTFLAIPTARSPVCREQRL